MIAMFRLIALLFCLSVQTAFGQEACTPIQPDGKPCVETTANGETSPGVWHWSFHNACGSPLEMRFDRKNGTNSGWFDIRAGGDDPFYCSDNCGGIVHHEEKCY